eukprot:SAG31_NODE_263_length_18841_cov_17.270996_16_plen_310_part_00
MVSPQQLLMPTVYHAAPSPSVRLSAGVSEKESSLARACGSPNAILSCSKGATCVDANSGGGATPAELAACERWTRDGGRGWQPSGEPCGGITGNLITNGGFEEPAITDGAVDCQGGHDSSFRGDDHCQYKYVFPTVSEFCHSSCSVPGWFVGTRAPSDDTTTPATYVALAENGNAPWGGLDSHMGTQYLVLEGSGAYIQQTVHGLSRGQVYELRLRMANRPGYGDDETLVIKMDNHIIGESNHPTDDFSEYGVAFTARGSTAVLQIENDTPNVRCCSRHADTCSSFSFVKRFCVWCCSISHSSSTLFSG